MRSLKNQASKSSVSRRIIASRTLLLESLTMRVKFGAWASDGASAVQIEARRSAASLAIPYDENSIVRSLERKRGSNRSVALQVNTKIVFGGKFVESSLDSKETWAA